MKRFGNLLGNSLSYQPYSDAVLKIIGVPKPRQEKPEPGKVLESISVLSAIPDSMVMSRYNAMNNRLVRESNKTLPQMANSKEKKSSEVNASHYNFNYEENKENIIPKIM